jgi:hypothetical protein
VTIFIYCTSYLIGFFVGWALLNFPQTLVFTLWTVPALPDFASLIAAKICINLLPVLPVLKFLEAQQPIVTPDGNGNALNQDSLIAKGWETTDYVGVILLVLSLVVLVGIVSRRIEYAIIFALMLSLLIIVFFLLA